MRDGKCFTSASDNFFLKNKLKMYLTLSTVLIKCMISVDKSTLEKKES